MMSRKQKNQGCIDIRHGRYLECYQSRYTQTRETQEIQDNGQQYKRDQ